MYRNSNVVLVLPIKILKRYTQKQDTLATLQKMIVLPCRPNWSKSTISRIFICLFIVLGMYNFVWSMKKDVTPEDFIKRAFASPLFCNFETWSFWWYFLCSTVKWGFFFLSQFFSTNLECRLKKLRKQILVNWGYLFSWPQCARVCCLDSIKQLGLNGVTIDQRGYCLCLTEVFTTGVGSNQFNRGTYVL